MRLLRIVPRRRDGKSLEGFRRTGEPTRYAMQPTVKSSPYDDHALRNRRGGPSGVYVEESYVQAAEPSLLISLDREALGT